MANSNKVNSSASIKSEIDYALERISFWFDRHQQTTGSEFAKESLDFWCGRVDLLDTLLPRVKTKIDYTPKKSVIDNWDAEPTFGQQAPKQEADLEDFYLSSKIVSFRGKPDQSKSKAKWQRSGKAARVLSNR